MAKRKEKPAPDEVYKIASNVDVKKFTARLLKLSGDMDNLRGDRNCVYDEARNAGVDVKALKETVKHLKKPIATDTRALVNIYLEKNGQLALFSGGLAD